MSGYKAADQKVTDLKQQKAKLQQQKRELELNGSQRRRGRNTVSETLKINNINGQISSLDTQIAAAQKQKQKEQQKLYKTKKKGLF